MTHSYIKFSPPKTWNLAALVIIAFGIFLRFYGLDFESLWSDELYTVAAALDVGPNTHWLSFSSKVIPELTFDDSFLTWKAADNTPPLFELLLILWSKIFGTSDLALRSLPAMLSSISLVIFYFGLKNTIGMRAAFIGTLFFSISAASITYSQEVRAYTLAALLCTLALTRLAHHVLHKDKNIWPDILIYVLLSYSHYTGLYMAGLFAGIYLLMNSLPQRRYSDILKFLIVPVLVMPWIYLSKKAFIFSSNGGYGWREYGSSDIVATMIPQALNFYAPSLGYLFLFVIAVLVLLTLFIEKRDMDLIVRTDVKRISEWERGTLLVILLLISLLLLFLYSVYNSFTSLMWHPRYFTVSLPVVFFLAAFLCALVPVGRKMFVVMLIMIFSYSSYIDLSDRIKNYPSKDQYREASDFLVTRLDKNALVVLGGKANEAFYRHYIDKYAEKLGKVFPIASASNEADIKEVCEKITTETRSIFVFQHSAMLDFGALVKNCRPMKFDRRTQFRNVHIDQYDVQI